jgi:glycosyltransferase involved in cell wall biosynthesis
MVHQETSKTSDQEVRGNSFTPGQKPLVSIVIPCLNEEKYIGTILTNITEQDYPPEFLEVMVVDGMSSDRTRSVVESYREKFSFIHFIENERRYVPFALNLGIRRSKGEVVMIMGSHAVYPDNYVSTLVAALYEKNADNTGGICEAVPPDPSLRSRSIACVISSVFGVGNAYFRIGASRPMKVDTVTFGCYRRSVFEKIGLFDEELIRNQDDEFNARLIRNGGSVWLIPEVKLQYFSRDKIRNLLRMYFQYGLFKPLVTMKIGRPATIRQLVPFAFVLFILAGLPAIFLNQVLCGIFMAVMGFYAITDLIFSLKICLKKRSPGLLLYLPWLFFLLHISYGAGYLSGMVNFVILRKKKEQIRTSR